MGTAESLNISSKIASIVTSSNECCNVNFDYVVVATGSQPRVNVCPGSAEYGLPFYTASDAAKLKAAMSAAVAKPTPFVHVVIVGGR